MNVLDKSSIHNCTSCGVCATICSKKAITIQLDAEGFYRPFIDADLCNDCGLCTSVCYKFDNELLITSIERLQDKPLFSAWAKDDEILKETTSGGLGDLLARQLQKNGYKVVGVVYNEDANRAEHRIALNEDDLLGFRGSKYIQSYTFDAFKEVFAHCRNEKFAVFGTPCQIYALNKLASQRKVRDNFFFVDLYCHGCPTLLVWKKFQDDVKRKTNIQKFDKVSFRSKLRGWGSFNVLVETNGKRISNGKYNDKYYELFFCDQLLNTACHDCKLRSTLEYTDIRLGDFWGKKFLKNQTGVSAISLATIRGQELFNNIKSDITFSQCKYQDFLPWQSWGKSYSIDTGIRTATIHSLINPEEDINDAIRVLRKNQPLKSNIKRIAKSTISILPLQFINYLKRVKYSLLK